VIDTDEVSEQEIELFGVGVVPPGWQKVPASENAFVAKRQGTDSVYFKLFYNRSRVEWLKSMVRGSRCQRAVDGATLLAQGGFRAPVTLQVGCIQGGVNKGLEFFVSESIPALGLADYVYEHWRRPLGAEQLVLKRNMLADLGRLIGQLHRKGIVHGDLRPNNVLVLESGAEPDFYFIDNERNSVSKSLVEKKRIKNLVQIGMLFPSVLSRTDRLRFFKTYCVESGLGSNVVRGLADEVFRLTNQRLAGRDAF